MGKNEFNIGDWVAVKLEETQFTGIITNKTELGYEVKDNNNYYQFVLEQYLECIDPKTAFLRDLSELLRKYGASVRAEIIGFEGMLPTMSFIMGNEQFYLPEQGEINADNILNYDK